MNKKKLLFCFTFAGGTSAFYDRIEECLNPEIELIKLEYAGHGKRHKEPLYDSFKELALDLYCTIKKDYFKMLNKDDCEYSFIGYSMGSISAVETLRLIMKKEEIKKPMHVFLAAHEPFTKAELFNYQANELDDYVKKRTIMFGGVPEQLINNRSFWRVYLPIYRSDYSMIAKYRFDKLDLKTDIPATVFYSEKDTKFSDMKEWANFFINKCDLVEYDGPHFFIDEHYEEMAQVIKERLECC